MRKVFKLIACLLTMSLITAQPLYAAGKTVKIKVTVEQIRLVENNHVGNEWYTVASVNGKAVAAGSAVTLTVKPTDAIKLLAYAEEQDKIPEDGTATVSVKASSVAKATTKTLKVVVTENRGRYSGNTATWKFTYKLQKVS